MELCRIEIPDPIESLTTGKKKQTTYSLGANIFWAGVNPYVQKIIKDQTRLFLHNYLRLVPVITQYPVEIHLEYHALSPRWDLDNKLFFWNKVICDNLVKDSKLKKDSTKYIRRIVWEYKKGPEKIILVFNTIDESS